jgi:hypothetical protein
MSSPLCLPIARATTANGDPISGALLHAYYTGTTTPVSIHTADGVEHTNPVVADAGGLFPTIYLSALTTYRFVLTDPEGAVIAEFDPVTIGVSGDHLNFGARLFTAYQNFNIPLGVDMVRTAGWDTLGRGDAAYIYDEAVDEAYVEANPRSAFISLNGRGFKLNERHLTPYMFGAHGFDKDNPVDDSDAIQACNDMAWAQEDMAKHFVDLTGNFGISKTLYLGGPVYSTAPALGNYEPFHTRHFRLGTLTPLEDFEPDVAHDGMTDAVWFIGVEQVYGGTFFFNGGFLEYEDRKVDNAIRLFYASRSQFENLRAEGVRRDILYTDPSRGETVIRAGSPYEWVAATSNNIGVQIDSIYGRAIGSYSAPGIAGQKWGLVVPFTAAVQGGTPAISGEPTEEFTSSSPTDYNGSILQRSRLAMSSAGIRRGDYIKLYFEIPESVYGSLTFDNAAGTITWESGDPLAAGMIVGRRYFVQNDPGADPATGSRQNAGLEFQLVSVSGTSNRTLHVHPEPMPDSDYVEDGIARTGTLHIREARPSLHWVANIPDADHVEVFPWADARMGDGGEAYVTHGYCANVTGPDTANFQINHLGGLFVGGVLNAGGLYCPHVGSLLLDFCSIAISHGYAPNAASLGLNVEHPHTEGAEIDYVQLSLSDTQSCQIGTGSNWGYRDRALGDYLVSPLTRCVGVGPRPFHTGTGTPPPRVLVRFGGLINGQAIQSRNSQPYGAASTFENEHAISNEPRDNRRTVYSTAYEAEITAQLQWSDETAALLGEHEAEVLWMNRDGSTLDTILIGETPTMPELTFNLSPAMDGAGWSFAGPNSFTGDGARAILFKIRYMREDESPKVMIFAFAADA